MVPDPFPALPDDARLWVLALAPPPPGADDAALAAGLEGILAAWRHKGQAYRAGWVLLEGGRLLLVAEPTMASAPSGCAIDGMLRKVTALAAAEGRPLLDEDRVLARVSGELRDFGRDELEARLADGTLGPATPVLDRSLHHLAQLRADRLERPLASTWIGRRHGVAAPA